MKERIGGRKRKREGAGKENLERRRPGGKEWRGIEMKDWSLERGQRRKGRAITTPWCSIPNFSQYEITSIPAKARFGRPYGKNGRLSGHIGETGSRSTAATQKNQLFDPGFLFAPSDSFLLGHTVSPQ